MLIYERIREELSAGKSILAPIDAGFKRAWGTSSTRNSRSSSRPIVLYFLGSGPVQGFAVTLALGILTSLFTAYTVTTATSSAVVRMARARKTLKIQLFRFIPDGTKIPFMKIAHTRSSSRSLHRRSRWRWFGFNGLQPRHRLQGRLGHRGAVAATAPPIPATVREIARASSIWATCRSRASATPDDLLVRIEAAAGRRRRRSRRPCEQVADSTGARRLRGPPRREPSSRTVSGELARPRASSACARRPRSRILIYVWFRFEWQFARRAPSPRPSHDVIMTIGLFAVTGIEFNQSSIAAMLTIVGYSSQRHGRHLRPHPREPAQIQEDVAARVDRSVDQLRRSSRTVADAVHASCWRCSAAGRSSAARSIRSFTIAMTLRRRSSARTRRSSSAARS